MVDHFFYFKTHNKKYYRQFLVRYERFFNKWRDQISDPEKLDELKPHLIIILGSILMDKISCAKNFKKVLKRYEEGSNKITDVERAVLKHYLDEIFLLPEIMMDSFCDNSIMWEADKHGIMRTINMQRGNPLDKRKDGIIQKYRLAAKLMKVLSESYPNINGIQKKACEIAGCSAKSFSRWKNFNEENNELYFMWQEEMDENVVEELKAMIEGNIGKAIS